ncbi:MAG: hypothetical protein RL514_3079 [Verrucomicrobiota bacterium]|jgi:hypothetical protein
MKRLLSTLCGLGYLLLLPTGGALHAQQYTWTTIAGQPGVSGSADGVGASARFDTPVSVAVDRFGVLHVADYNHIIRKLTPARVVSTFVGLTNTAGTTDGIGPAARFNLPHSGAFDAV